MPKIEYPLPAFDGGLNSKYEAYIIADNESPDCLNAYADDLGGVQTRNGSTKLNTLTAGTFPNHGLFTLRYQSGNQTMVGWWNGGMKALNTTTFVTIGSAQSVYTAGIPIVNVMYQDLAFFGNGYSTNYKYNGTEFTRMGIEAPNSSPTISTNAAGNVPAGAVNYKVTYMNSYVVEGDVGPATATFTVAASAIVSMQCIPVAPQSFGIAARKIYRKDSTTGGAYKYLTTLSDNTTTFFGDNVASTDLGPNAPTDNGIPLPMEMAVVHKERIFFKTPAEGFIYYTELGNPFVQKVLNFEKIGDGDGEIVRGLGVHADSIVGYKDVSAWVLYMQDTDPLNWSVTKTNSKYGAAGPFSIVDYEGYQMSLGRNFEGAVNFAALSGGAALPSVTLLNVTAIQSDSKGDRIEPDVRLFGQSLLRGVFGIRFKNKLWFAVPYGVTATANTRVYVFDYFQRDKDRAEGAWWPLSYPFNFSYLTVYNGKLYGAVSDATGFVYEIDPVNVYSDDGTAIDSYFWTKEFDGYKEQKENHKDFRRLDLTMQTLGNWNVGISQRVDSDISQGNLQTVNVSPGGGLWGSMVWGVGSWGGGILRKRFPLELGTSNGVKIQFRFDNQATAGRAFKVLRGSFFYNNRGRR